MPARCHPAIAEDRICNHALFSEIKIAALPLCRRARSAAAARPATNGPAAATLAAAGPGSARRLAGAGKERRRSPAGSRHSSGQRSGQARFGPSFLACSLPLSNCNMV